MSICNLRQINSLQLILLKKFIRNGLASDARKSTASATANASPSMTFGPITEEKKHEAQKIDPGPANISSTKPNLNVVVNPAAGEFVKIAPTIRETPAIDVTTLSFDEVPGPHSLRIFAKILSFMPVIGHKFTSEFIQYVLSAATLYIGSQLTWGSNIWLFGRMINGYGPVVRCYGPFGGNIVLLSRPEHARIVLENDGPYPVRSFMDSLEKYRLQYRKTQHSGIFLTYGPEWAKLRKAAEEPLQICLPKQTEKVNKICEEFVSRIITIRNSQEEVPPNFLQEVHKWCLECFCSVIFNRRLGFLDPCGLSTISDPGRMLSGFEGATDAIRRCEYGVHMWRLMETPAWKSLVKNCDALDNIFGKYMNRAQESLNERKTSGTTDDMTMLEHMLLKEGVTPEDVKTIMLDMMIVGVNATSCTVAFLLYHLARSPRCQLKLYNEIQLQPDTITSENMKSMAYMKACIEETLRLEPPIPIMNRKLTRDIVVHNYRIPKDTHVLMPMHLSSMKEEHFEDAHKFKPERWLPKQDDLLPGIRPYTLVSFGYGPKACFAKSLGELQVGAAVAKILKKFSIEYYHGDINSTHTMIAAPTGPLRLRFTDRK